jgi:hypothetical protein
MPHPCNVCEADWSWCDEPDNPDCEVSKYEIKQRKGMG